MRISRCQPRWRPLPRFCFWFRWLSSTVRTGQSSLAGAMLEIVGQEYFIAKKAFAGGPWAWRMRVRLSIWIASRPTRPCCVNWRIDSVATRRELLKTSSAPWTDASPARMNSSRITFCCRWSIDRYDLNKSP